MQLIALKGLPLIKQGDDLSELIVRATREQNLCLEDGDVLVIAQSVVSKSEGHVVDLCKVNPSPRAQHAARQLNEDPRLVDVILQQSKEIVKLAHVLIARTEHGFICASAGVDRSNVEPEHATLLPKDPDASAKRIQSDIARILGVDVAVIISDSHGRPWRRGAAGVALGVSGMLPLLDLRGRRDLYGKPLKKTWVAIADSLAAAAGVLMGEADEGTPVVVIKGARYERGEGRRENS